MASGKQGLQVVVWEWENKQRRWRPYPPEVAQQLERAYSKNLRSVFLGDSDPSLKDYCIHLPQMEQECKKTGHRVKVRRNFFPQSSPAGQGAVWQWGGDVHGDWHTYDMCVQCVMEESWTTGAQTLDMGETFTACPYVIDFCNMTQMNNKTGFIRSIRRLQQASYPAGKPPASFYSNHTHNTQGASGETSYCNSKGLGAPSFPGTSCSGEKQRHRGTRDDPESFAAENKPRALLSKVLCRGSKNSTSSPPGTSDISNSGHHISSWVTKNGPAASPPKPLPRSSVPPVPRPRTLPPPGEPHSQQSTSQLSYSPQNKGAHHLLKDQNTASQMAQNFKIELSDKFGSNHTLDSDCSSLLGGRRPSVDTISTYLSQDDDPNHSNYCSGHTETGYMSSLAIDKLISVESDENMDEDVFAEDQEVCDVMRGVAGPSPPLRVSSPLTLGQSHYHHNSSTSKSQMSSLQQCHFMPINAAHSGSDSGLHMNGVKRKRTREKALPNMSQLQSPECSTGDVSPWDSHHHTSSRHHFTGKNHKGHHGSRAPIAAEDKLLLQYTSVVESPPDDMCSICMWSLTEASGYLEEEPSKMSHQKDVQNDGVVSLNLCKHQFHLACVREMAKSSPQFLECPNCKTLHGEKLGNQPPGNMNVTTVHRSLPGHPDCNTIQVTYSISSGMQGPEHPHPGRPYRAIGFPRVAYIPNNDKGKKVVRLLQEAWRRRLIFTVGPSVTMGWDDCVTWNEIHHKTEWNNRAGHGYPDPGYLDNALKELALHGVTDSI